jgi:hypothetical protein
MSEWIPEEIIRTVIENVSSIRTVASLSRGKGLFYGGKYRGPLSTGIREGLPSRNPKGLPGRFYSFAFCILAAGKLVKNGRETFVQTFEMSSKILNG